MLAEILRNSPVTGAKSSGGSAFVSMMKSADLGHCNNPAQFRRFNGSGIWRVLPELEEFAVQSRGSPQNVRLAHASDQCSDLLGRSWPSHAAPTALQLPVESESFSMPAYDRFRLDQHERLAPAGPEAKQGHPEEAV